MIATAKLGDVAEFIRGITFKPTDIVEPGTDGAIACMRTSNVQQSLETDDVLYVPESFVGRDEQYLQTGDMLVSSANSWNLVGKACWVPDLGYKATAGGFISILRALPGKVDQRYLYHWFTDPKTQTYVRNCGRQTTNISNLSIPRCLALPLPLPPLAEQKRIAAVLDKADDLRAKRRRALAVLDTLLQSVFLDMFGDPVTNPKGWNQSKLGSLCEVGSSSRVFVEELVREGVPFYRGTEIGALGAGESVTPSLFIAPKHYEELKAHSGVPCLGDLMLPSICPDGRIFIVRDDKPFYFKDGRVLWIKAGKSGINSTFLRYHLKHLFAANYAKIASGTTFAELKIFALQALVVHVPPPARQADFERFVNSWEKQVAGHRAQIAALDALFASLQSAAFTGTLFPQSSAAECPTIDSAPVRAPLTITSMSTTDLHAGVLAIAYRMHDSAGKTATFGHVKAEKIAHLVESHLGLNFGRSPVKDAAGPNDFPHLKKVEHRAKMANYFNFQRAGARYKVTKLNGFDRLVAKTEAALGERLTDLRSLVSLLVSMDTQQAEIVATVYAAWNNLLLNGTQPSEELVVREARENWHEKKLAIERSRFFAAIGWMRSRALVPAGTGKLVNSLSRNPL